MLDFMVVQDLNSPMIEITVKVQICMKVNLVDFNYDVVMVNFHYV